MQTKKPFFIPIALALLMSQAFASVNTSDAVVVGSGGAGLSAAITLHDLGKSVVVFEKMPFIGGNTLRAEGGINAAETQQQKDAGIPDTISQFYEDTMKGGHEKNDPALVHTLTEHAKDSVKWLTELGADLSVVGRAGGAKYNRAHRPTGGGAVGPEIIKTLVKAAKTRNIPIERNTKVVELLRDKDGAVAGVKIKTKDGQIHTVHSKTIILAAGGFGANNTMVAQYQPKLKGYSTTNQPGATGDGIDLATKVGAALVDMQYIQAHPTATPDGSLISESVRGDGAILVNAEGKRFTNELLTRDVVSANELKQPGKFSWIIWDDQTRSKAKLMDDYIKLGVTVTGKNISELAKAMNVPAKNLESTIKRYAEMQKNGKDEDFGRPNMPESLTHSPYWAVKVQPAVHHTMGGLKINSKAQVLDSQGKVIPGLFAAGEVTGGVHGANRLGGNAQADIVTFGRIAGQSAATYLK